MTPIQILMARQEFLRRMEGDDAFKRYVKAAVGASALVPGEVARKTIGAVMSQMRNGETYRVTAPMTDLVEYAASRLDDTDRYQRDLPPTAFGVVRFDRPLTVFDARGSTMLAHWATWGPVTLDFQSPLGVMREQSAILISLWNDTLTEPDPVIWEVVQERHKPIRELQHELGRWAFIGTSVLSDGSDIGPGERYLSEAEIALMVESDRKFMDATGLTDTSPFVGPPTNRMTNVGRLMHALWLLLGQTVTSMEEETLPRSSRAMVARMKFPPKVTVIQLRRRESRPSEGESRVQWMHRWMVRGHWRNQPYGDGSVRRIWIAPFVKGPEGLPFVQSEKVYSLSR